MSELIMIVGLPASGKSTVATELSKLKHATIVSSDEMRAELFGDVNNQDNNVLLFDEVHKRINDILKSGKNVIYDATNINRKRRVHLINDVLKADSYKVYYMNTPLYDCIENDSKRNKSVGVTVIDKMYRNMHIPTALEGWDEVTFINFVKEDELHRERFESCLYRDSHNSNHEKLFSILGDMINDFMLIYDTPQDSSYHSFSISRHTYYVFKHIKDNLEQYKGIHQTELLIAALFHDLGKYHCKSFYNYKGEEKRYASFIGHENVSAQLAAQRLVELGYDDSLVKYVVDLIQFHMTPMDMSRKQEKKLRGLITEDQYNDLMFLHEADLSAK